MQGKGGVGKTTVAMFLIQSLRHYANDIEKETGQKINIIGVDTDPVNQTFASFESLNISPVFLMGQDNEVDPLKFDVLVDAILSTTDNFVIDTGATNYLPTFNYIKNNDILDILHDQGKQTFIHVPISGGQATIDTLEELKELTKEFNNAHIVIWENKHYGQINLKDNIPYKDNPDYSEAIKKSIGTIVLEKFDPKTTGRLYETMTSELKTFDDVFNDPKTPFMTKRRLMSTFNAISEQVIDLLNKNVNVQKKVNKKGS